MVQLESQFLLHLTDVESMKSFRNQNQILAGFLFLSTNFREASRTTMDCRTVATSSMSSLQIVISICILPPENIVAAVRMRTKRRPSSGRVPLY